MITKRQLGLIFIFLGIAAIVGMLGMDLLGAGQHLGIGPAQQKALFAAGLIILIGITLIPLGAKPA